jgi:hypothetical protein
MGQIRVLACLTAIAVSVLPRPASAWNIPGHMLSDAIAYQVLQQENPQTVEKVKAALEKHPRYANQWQTGLQDVHVAHHKDSMKVRVLSDAGVSTLRDFDPRRECA